MTLGCCRFENHPARKGPVDDLATISDFQGEGTSVPKPLCLCRHLLCGPLLSVPHLTFDASSPRTKPQQYHRTTTKRKCHPNKCEKTPRKRHFPVPHLSRDQRIHTFNLQGSPCSRGARCERGRKVHDSKKDM